MWPCIDVLKRPALDPSRCNQQQHPAVKCTSCISPMLQNKHIIKIQRFYSPLKWRETAAWRGQPNEDPCIFTETVVWLEMYAAAKIIPKHVGFHVPVQQNMISLSFFCRQCANFLQSSRRFCLWQQQLLGVCVQISGSFRLSSSVLCVQCFNSRYLIRPSLLTGPSSDFGSGDRELQVVLVHSPTAGQEEVLAEQRSPITQNAPTRLSTQASRGRPTSWAARRAACMAGSWGGSFSTEFSCWKLCSRYRLPGGPECSQLSSSGTEKNKYIKNKN